MLVYFHITQMFFKIMPISTLNHITIASYALAVVTFDGLDSFCDHLDLFFTI